MKHAMQFTKTSEAIADYVQINFNSDVAEAIQNVDKPTFKMQPRPEKKMLTDEKVKTILESPEEVELFIWKKECEKLCKRQADYKEKEKRVFPIILGQCSPSPHSQLEGGKGFKKICKENDVVELLKLFWGFGYHIVRTMIKFMLY